MNWNHKFRIKTINLKTAFGDKSSLHSVAWVCFNRSVAWSASGVEALHAQACMQSDLTGLNGHITACFYFYDSGEMITMVTDIYCKADSLMTVISSLSLQNIENTQVVTVTHGTVQLSHGSERILQCERKPANTSLSTH